MSVTGIASGNVEKGERGRIMRSWEKEAKKLDIIAARMDPNRKELIKAQAAAIGIKVD